MHWDTTIWPNYLNLIAMHIAYCWFVLINTVEWVCTVYMVGWWKEQDVQIDTHNCYCLVYHCVLFRMRTQYLIKWIGFCTVYIKFNWWSSTNVVLFYLLASYITTNSTRNRHSFVYRKPNRKKLRNFNLNNSFECQIVIVLCDDGWCELIEQ